MTVRKEKRGDREVYRVDFWFAFPNGKRKRFKKDSHVNTKRGAEQFEREWREKLQKDDYRTGPCISFKDFAKEFQDVYVKGNLKFATQITYESTIRVHLLPAFANCQLDDLPRTRSRG